VAATNKQRSILAMTGHVTLSRAGEVRAAARFVLLRACTEVIGMHVHASPLCTSSHAMTRCAALVTGGLSVRIVCMLTTNSTSCARPMRITHC
jgi:hypothetical protein